MSWTKTGERCDATIRTQIRKQFRVSNHVPVVEGDVEKPTIHGTAGGWYTKGGTPIAHPSAYSKKGFSNMVYECSTRMIVIPKRNR